MFVTFLSECNSVFLVPQQEFLLSFNDYKAQTCFYELKDLERRRVVVLDSIKFHDNAPEAFARYKSLCESRSEQTKEVRQKEASELQEKQELREKEKEEEKRRKQIREARDREKAEKRAQKEEEKKKKEEEERKRKEEEEIAKMPKCPDCGERFPSKNKLKKHQEESHE